MRLIHQRQQVIRQHNMLNMAARLQLQRRLHIGRFLVPPVLHALHLEAPSQVRTHACHIQPAERFHPHILQHIEHSCRSTSGPQPRMQRLIMIPHMQSRPVRRPAHCGQPFGRGHFMHHRKRNFPVQRRRVGKIHHQRTARRECPRRGGQRLFKLGEGALGHTSYESIFTSKQRW